MQDFTTPMMKQYVDIKKQYMDCLLFFRMGDFYELFLEDAHIGAKVLDIVLTSRAKGKDGRIPMAGVPYHAVDSYIAKLVKAGYKVAICEQITEPNKYGIVEREVIRIITPGTILDEHTLQQKENNFIMSLMIHKDTYGLAVADITTGSFQIYEFNNDDHTQTLVDEIMRIKPSECVLIESLYNSPIVLKQLKEYKKLNIYSFAEGERYLQSAEKIVEVQFGKQLVIQPNLKNMKIAIQAAAILIGYLKYTQKDNIVHFKSITPLSQHNHMIVDYSTSLNLELFTTLRTNEKKGTLIEFLDHTITAMGGRKLRDWLHRPLTDKNNIIERHNGVEEFLQKIRKRKDVVKILQQITDVERIISRLSLGLGNARDMIQLKESLIYILQIKDVIIDYKSSYINALYNQIDDSLRQIIQDIERIIVDEPPAIITEGRMIKSGIDTKLDELKVSVFENKEWLEELEKKERQRTGISSLKIRFNKVFGFYIEISKANLHNVPADYVRKQTLVNAERFITDDLKAKEELILSGEHIIFDIELKIYKKLLATILESTYIIQQAANSIAVIDCLVTFATIAELHQFSRPEIIDTDSIDIIDGKHPVVEQAIGDAQFVPNNTLLDQKNNQLLLITGPNMAGKSVYIRQVALIALLNQIGSFVPAQQAKIGIVDRIFVRSGASDMIADGLSTFMVEMVETAQILQKATSKSLVIMDEIGRGTSTYDGISIAWAIAEYIVTNTSSNPKTLFATHYHELQELEEKHPARIKNYHMAIADEKGRPVFLYRLLPKGASHSYGIAVAELAGIPKEVISQAYDVLQQLEKRDTQKETNLVSQKIQDKNDVLKQMVENIDINQITPLQAFEFLTKLKKTYEKDP
ncbi:MAG TPA: DNA mismatch repair protein MutS [Candidatus Woesebacteria bacterium]|mgnify:CR=1 FL=1|nr:DNA mismatch repair protein MutS [Candidatus Woesebacteria bacterium]